MCADGQCQGSGSFPNFITPTHNTPGCRHGHDGGTSVRGTLYATALVPKAVLPAYVTTVTSMYAGYQDLYSGLGPDGMPAAYAVPGTYGPVNQVQIARYNYAV